MGVTAPSTDPHASAVPMSVTAETVGASVVSAGPSAPAAKPTSPVDGGPTVAVTAAPPTMSTPPQATGAGPTPAPVTSVPAWMQQAVQAQLAGRLVAAARGGEPGTVQRLTLHLHPADLGTVQVVATLDDGTVSLQLMAGSAATRDALRASLGALRSDLAAAGLDGARLDVSDQPPGSQQGLAQHQAGASREGSSHRPTGGSQAATTAATGRPDRGPEPTAARAGVPQGVRADRGVDLHL
jgi:flagellar hook-length control protein FliK